MTTINRELKNEWRAARNEGESLRQFARRAASHSKAFENWLRRKGLLK